MRNIHTIVFDLGRVLVNIHATGPKFGRLMRDIGVSPEDVFDSVWHTNEIRGFMTGEYGEREFHRRASARFGLTYSFEEFCDAWCDIFAPVPAMQGIFHELAMHYRLGILSDTDPLHWRYLRNMLPWLAEAGKPTLSFEVGYLKPHSAMFAAAAADNGCSREECLFIDDRIGNVDGARHFGMPALLFTGAEKLRRDLSGLMVM